MNDSFNSDFRNLRAVPKSNPMVDQLTDKNKNSSKMAKSGICNTPPSNTPAVGSSKRIINAENQYRANAAGTE